jgi:hypothetical protein
MKLCLLPSLAIVMFSSACNSPASTAPNAQPSASVAPVAPATPVAVPSVVVATPALAAPVGNVALAAVAPAASATTVAKRMPTTLGESKVLVKRFVVATGVQDREPLTSGDALPADGSAIYAFAELANPIGDGENVRITFERKGGRERVGEVTLPVPANTSRHRTWAFTRFIRAAGVWEAVLWSENGTELSRTSFEVKAS